jgi:hypothetical protein
MMTFLLKPDKPSPNDKPMPECDTILAYCVGLNKESDKFLTRLFDGVMNGGAGISSSFSKACRMSILQNGEPAKND